MKAFKTKIAIEEVAICYECMPKNLCRKHFEEMYPKKKEEKCNTKI